MCRRRRRHACARNSGAEPSLRVVVHDTTGWTSAGTLAGEHLDTLLDSARRRWNAQPHAAAALAWLRVAQAQAKWECKSVQVMM